MESKIDLKVVLLGKEYGGKTSLVERFIHQRFNSSVPYQNTIGAAFGARAIQVDGKKITLGIWDTAGSERYEAMSRIYYRGAKAAIVCYDLTDDTSWDRARFWIQEVHAHEEACRIYLCGTKLDLLDKVERAVDYHDTTDYADFIQAKLFETSSKDGTNIVLKVSYLVSKIYIEQHQIITTLKPKAIAETPKPTIYLIHRGSVNDELFNEIASDYAKSAMFLNPPPESTDTITLNNQQNQPNQSLQAKFFSNCCRT